MKKARYLLPIMALFLLLANSCEKKDEKHNDLSNELLYGNISGIVKPIESNATITVKQEKTVAQTSIDSLSSSFRIEDIHTGNFNVLVETDNYKNKKIENVKVEGGETIFLGTIELKKLPDLVKSHEPGKRDEVVFDNRWSELAITIVFEESMDRASIEKAFSTVPSTDGRFQWNQRTPDKPIVPHYFESSWLSKDQPSGGSITTYSKVNSVTYTIAQKDCFVDTTYKVVLNTNARDTAGNNLKFPLEFRFFTVQSGSSLNAIQTNPHHGDVNVPLVSSSGIQITFPRNMNKSVTENAIHVSPDTDPILIWESYNELTIYTGGVYKSETNYEITIDSVAEDLDGTKLGNPYTFSFTTAPVKVDHTNPRRGELFVALSEDIEFNFNTYMSKSSVQNSFSIEPQIDGTIDFYNSSYNTSKTKFVFDPATDFKSDTKYTVTINTNAKDIYGTNLKEDFTFSFVTRPE